MNNPAHPVYGLARFTVMMCVLAFTLWLFATKFDESEVKAMGTFAGTIVALLGAERLAKLKVRT